MKCPHCEYIYGWDDEAGDFGKDITPKEGRFYASQVKLERESYDRDEVRLYGCPKCFKTFIDNY